VAGLGIAISDARGFCYSLQPAAEKKEKTYRWWIFFGFEFGAALLFRVL
jgi:hypothetical protein